MNVRNVSFAAPILAMLAALAMLVASADAGQPGGWRQISNAHNGATSNLGLARGKDGALHVLWAGPGRSKTAIYDTPISPAGAVGKPRAVNQFASSPPFARRSSGSSPSAAIARRASTTTGSSPASRNDSYCKSW